MSRLWSTYTAAPHRVMFLPGAVQAALVMLWWLVDLESRRAGGAGLAPAGLPGPAMHGWWMLYGCFPFFVFGFLFTAAPNWLSAPAVPRRVHVASGLALTAGALLVHAGIWLPGAAVAGLAVHLAGWALALAALVRVLRQGSAPDKRHPAIATVAVGLGGLGAAAFLAWAAGDWPALLPVAQALGVWGFLAPTFLAVCHRMIPWFTGRIVPNYVMIRPYGPLWALLAGSLVHGALEAAGYPDGPWPADLGMAAIVFWFSSRWGVALGVRQPRLLAMLHVGFLWAGAGLLLYGLSGLAGALDLAWSAGRAPVHALGIGFFATMLVGMASRVSLGHSGRPLEADGVTWGLFWLVQAVAVMRMLPDLMPLPEALVTLAGALWLAAFGLWAWRYAPMYWRARVDGKAG